MQLVQCCQELWETLQQILKTKHKKPTWHYFTVQSSSTFLYLKTMVNTKVRIILVSRYLGTGWYLLVLSSTGIGHWVVHLSVFMNNRAMKKALREMETLRAGCSKVEPKNFHHAADPFPRGAGRPKFNQLKMVTTFTYKPTQSGEDWMHSISSYRGNRPTHTGTHPPTDRTDYNTLHCS